MSVALINELIQTALKNITTSNVADVMHQANELLKTSLLLAQQPQMHQLSAPVIQPIQAPRTDVRAVESSIPTPRQKTIIDNPFEWLEDSRKQFESIYNSFVVVESVQEDDPLDANTNNEHLNKLIDFYAKF